MPVVKKQSALPPRKITTKTTSSQTQTSKYRSGWELTKNIKMLLYGKSGTGKTTLWATFPGPILALICSGGKEPGELLSIDTEEYREKVRPLIVDRSSDIMDMVNDNTDCSTIVLDHASSLQDLILAEILGVDEIPAQKGWGTASQQTYGELALRCKDLFRKLLSRPCNLVIVAQERVFGGSDESAGMDPSSIIAPTIGAAMSPSIVGWLNPACDYVVQTFIRPHMETVVTKVAGKDKTITRRGKGYDYCLRTEPSDVYMIKFRRPKADGGVNQDEAIVNPTYDKILEAIKSR